MAYTFADYPELAFALPFENMSFERWDSTLPDQWAQTDDPGVGTRAKSNPGFDSTRALKISDTGIITAPQNGIKQTLVLPTYLENGQIIRAGMCVDNNLGGAYGAAKAVMAITQNAYAYALVNFVYNGVQSGWQLCEYDGSNPISTSYTDLILTLDTRSSSDSSDPAALFDCIFAEYGRTIAERYYTFVRKPEFSGLDITKQTFTQKERTGIGKQRSYDPTGGAVKWVITMPFVNIPGAMVEALHDFFNRNKGLDDAEGVHLVLHHKLINISDTFNLRIPPWFICDIAEKDWPFKFSGGYLGAKLYSGTLTFEEV
jgi:hypothetical protein